MNAEDQIDARTEVLNALELALGRFASDAGEHHESITDATRKRLRSLDDRRSELKRRIARLEESMSDSRDEDDRSDYRALQRAIEDAEDELGRVQVARRRLEDAAASFRSEQRQLQEILGPHTEMARQFVRDAIDKLQAYRAIQPDQIGLPLQKSFGIGTDQLIPRLTEAETHSCETVPLPNGFVWVSLQDINVEHELADVKGPSDFKKTSYSSVKNALERFYTKILPELLAGTSRDALTSRDLEAGVFDSSGLGGAYDIFFGGDAIRLEPNQAGRGHGITDGRHRIRVALDSGWTHVPATISGKRDE